MLTLLGNGDMESGVKAEKCFDTQQFPKLFGSKVKNDYSTYTHSITSSEALDAVFTGGNSGKDGGVAWIMRVNVDTNRV